MLMIKQNSTTRFDHLPALGHVPSPKTASMSKSMLVMEEEEVGLEIIAIITVIEEGGPVLLGQK